MPTKKQLEDKIAMLNDALETALSVSPERDNNFFTGGLSSLYENRNSWDRKKIFAEALRAWRVNPIARRIVTLTSSFVIGKNLKIKASRKDLQDFLDEWAEKNQLRRNLKRWKDEDTRTGNLFILFNVLPNKMTILRAVPAEQIEEIITAENDVEQEIKYTKDAAGDDVYPAYDPNQEQTIFMKHYASNKPVGSPWGEADLSPLLVWIGRFSSWLEDRARLNRYRTAFMYVVRGAYNSEAERAAREKTINANPPKPGSVLVTNSNNGEEWDILSSKLDSFEATSDGLAIKKMIAAGVGFPLHWLAEPESATRTTAEAAGTPSFRTLEDAQRDFFEAVIDMAATAATVKGFTVASGDIWIEGSDITERDNATLALALGRAYPQLADLYDRGGIDSAELLRLTYKMIAEVWEGNPPSIQRKPLIPTQPPTIKDTNTAPTDPENHEEDNPEGKRKQ